MSAHALLAFAAHLRRHSDDPNLPPYVSLMLALWGLVQDAPPGTSDIHLHRRRIGTLGMSHRIQGTIHRAPDPQQYGAPITGDADTWRHAIAGLCAYSDGQGALPAFDPQWRHKGYPGYFRLPTMGVRVQFCHTAWQPRPALLCICRLHPGNGRGVSP